MKIAYAQMKVAAGHPDINMEKILRLISEARAHGADIVIFPDLSTLGEMLGKTWDQSSFLNECEFCNEDIIAASQNIVVVFGSVYVDDFWTFNTIYVAGNGKLLLPPIRKTVLTPDGQAPCDSRNKEKTGFYIKDKYFMVGLIFGGERVAAADFCINFYHMPFSLGRREDFANYGCPTIQVGAVGVQNTGKTIYTFDGRSAVINSSGEVVQRAEPFAECLNYVELEAIDKMPALAPIDEPDVVKIHRALKYGVKNFLEQIGLQRVVIGVSGGIDSAVAAALYTEVLGAENVYLVNMPSVFNSATTKNLSEQLAKNLGCKYFVVPIQESVDWTVKQLEGVGVSVSSFVRENIQARDRSSSAASSPATPTKPNRPSVTPRFTATRRAS